MTLEFRGLGTIEVWYDGRTLALGGAKQRGLLALLMLEPNRVVPLDRLLDRLWPDGKPNRPTLYRLASRLRGVLAASGHDVLISRSGGYLLAVDSDQVDIHRFERLVRDGRRQLAAERAESAAGMLDEALALWRGGALTGVPETVRAGTATRLEELRLLATEERIAAELTLGQGDRLIPDLYELVAEHPWRERLIGQLMTALHRSGRRAEALEAYRHARQQMIEELGLEPGAELQRLHAQLLAAEPNTDRREDVPRQLPVEVSAFIGRADHLHRLDELVDASRPAEVVAISGMAGVGKTTLAVRWAHRAAPHFPDGQLYIDLRGFDPSGQLVSPDQAVRGFLDAFSVSAERIPADPDAQSALFRSTVAGKRILILLDNARDAGQVRPLLAGGPGSLTVITSRDQLPELLAAEGAHALLVDPLDLDEGRELLTRRLGDERTSAEPQAVNDIIHLCAGLPLALAIVAARGATHPHHQLAALAAELRHAHSRLDLLADAGSGTDVRAVFSWSYGQLDAEAAQLVRLLGQHPGPDFTSAATASLAGVPLRRAQRLLAQLCRVHLVTEHRSDRHTFHDLLRAYAAELASKDCAAHRQTALHRLFDHYLHSTYAAFELLHGQKDFLPSPAAPGTTLSEPADREQARAWFSLEWPTLVAIVMTAADIGFDGHAWHLTRVLGEYLEARGHWRAWVAVQHAALAAAQRLGDRSAQALAHRMLGRAYLRLGHDSDALAHLDQALVLNAEIDHYVGLARTHGILAGVVGRDGRPADQLEHAVRALELFQIAGDRLGEAYALNEVGWAYAQLGDHIQALTSCQRALDVNREVGDPVNEAGIWDSLGYVHHHLGRHEQATTCYRRSLYLYGRLDDRYKIGETLCHLGDAQYVTGYAAAARASWRQALAIFDELGHRDAEQVRARLATSTAAGRQLKVEDGG